MSMTKRSIIVFAVTFALLGISICFNVWQTSKIWELDSEIDELRNLREPLVHLIYYEWKVVVINWEHEYVQVNYTLFNSGYTNANFTLSIDLFDNQEPFKSKEWEIQVNATSKKVFTDVRIYCDLLVDPHHADAIEFNSIYFHEYSNQSNV